jgi:hypothetical protein
MHPDKVVREAVVKLTDLPNIGPASAADLRLIGVDTPQALLGRDPWDMYAELCARTGMRQDPCVIDVFISVTRFMAGEAARPWWAYSAERKQVTGGKGGGRH